MPAAAIGLAAAGVLLLASCSSPASPEQYLPEPATPQAAVDCSTATGWEASSTEPAARLKGSVPDGFVPVEVVTCTLDPATMTATEEWLSGDFGPLLAALATPSERGGPASCLDYAEILPAIWLVNAEGKAIDVQWPMDSCDHSLPGTAAALAALTAGPAKTLPAKDATS